jgi:hypothetical protein
MPTFTDPGGNSQIVYTYISFVTTVDNNETTVIKLTNMTYNYDPLGVNNTVATLPNEVTEIAENFADGDLIPSLKNITQLIIGENVRQFGKGICRNWTNLTHLTLNMQTENITVDVDYDSFRSSSMSNTIVYEIPTSFQNSPMNTITMFSNDISRNILLHLVGDVTDNIRTLNIIDGSLSITGIIQGFNRTPRDQTEFNSVSRFYILLTSISIPNSVTSIGDAAFFKCIALTSVSMPQVTSIGLLAFAYCTELTSVSMPRITSIGFDAFEVCPINIQSLQQLYYQGVFVFRSNPYYGISQIIWNNIRPYGISGTTITSIFLHESDSYYINIPNTITGIEPNAALNATFLTALTIPASVTSIGANSFSGCSNLTSVVLPGSNDSGLATLGETSFFQTNVSQPSLQTMRNQGYTKSALEAAGFTNVPVAAITYNISPDSTILNSITVSVENVNFAIIDIPSSVTRINSNVIANINKAFLTSLTIPSTVGTIDENAFSGCSNLTTLVLEGTSLKTLGANAFFYTNVNTTYLNTIRNQDYTAMSLRIAGFNITQLKEGAYSAYQLKEANYTIADLQSVQYSTSDILAAGYSQDELQAAGLYSPPVTPVPCFNEDSKILCLVDGEEKELLVQNIRNGVLVKTLHAGYKPVCMIGTSVICNPGTNERFKDRLFICKKERYPELNQDLIITGCHSILVDNITDEQREQTMIQMKDIYVTEGKYRLNANLDDRAQPYNCPGNFNIYHIALEHENYYKNYGVYANGLLVETCSKRYLKELSNMTLL